MSVSVLGLFRLIQAHDMREIVPVCLLGHFAIKLFSKGVQLDSLFHLSEVLGLE